MTNILILDGNQRSSLATARSLGKKGHKIYIIDSLPKSLAGCSKYCTQYIQLSDISTNQAKFIEELQAIISKYNIEIMMPMTDVSTATILKQQEQFTNIGIPAPSYESYNEASNKNSLFKLAISLGIPIPKTIFIGHVNEIDYKLNELTYPIVIKPSKSRVLVNNHWLSTQVSYAHSLDDLKNQVKESEWLQSFPFMIQEYIQGEGQGIFAFYEQGKPITFFAHKRLREKPPSGGVSVLRESTPVNPRMQEISKKLLDHIGWHGAAMVEFIVSNDGTPYLIEINGRFWGSLQLSIDAGIDFPHLAYLLAANKPLPTNINYRPHIRSRWLLGDLDRLYLVLKADKTDYSTYQKISEIMKFMKFFSPDTHYEINRLSDFKPFIYEMKNYLKDAVKALK